MTTSLQSGGIGLKTSDTALCSFGLRESASVAPTARLPKEDQRNNRFQLLSIRIER
jgi:hypothetical protein